MRSLFIIFLFLLCSLHTAAQAHYDLSGEMPAAYNGQYLYLYGLDYSGLNEKISDSVQITDGHFRFTGALHTPGMLASVYLKDYRVFFTQAILENRPVHMQPVFRDSTHPFSTAVYRNGPINQQHIAWKAATDSASLLVAIAFHEIDSLQAQGGDSALLQQKQTALISLRAALLEKQVRFIRQHPADYISLYWLRYTMLEKLTAHPGTLDSLFTGLAAPLRQLPEGKALRNTIQSIKVTQPGRPLPDFLLPDSLGRSFSLRDFKGKYLVLDFWASWCAPCVAALPEMKAIYARYHGKGLEMISISLDTERERWIGSLHTQAMPWTQVCDLKGWEGAVPRQYFITYIPKTILVDKNGKIIKVDPDLRAELAKLL